MLPVREICTDGPQRSSTGKSLAACGTRCASAGESSCRILPLMKTSTQPPGVILRPTWSPCRSSSAVRSLPLAASSSLTLSATPVFVKSTTHDRGTSTATAPSSSISSGSHAVTPRPKSFRPSSSSGRSSPRSSRQTSRYWPPRPQRSGASPRTTSSLLATRRAVIPKSTMSTPAPRWWLLKRHATSTRSSGASRAISASSCCDFGTTSLEADLHAGSQALSFGASVSRYLGLMIRTSRSRHTSPTRTRSANLAAIGARRASVGTSMMSERIRSQSSSGSLPGSWVSSCSSSSSISMMLGSWRRTTDEDEDEAGTLKESRGDGGAWRHASTGSPRSFVGEAAAQAAPSWTPQPPPSPSSPLLEKFACSFAALRERRRSMASSCPERDCRCGPCAAEPDRKDSSSSSSEAIFASSAVGFFTAALEAGFFAMATNCARVWRVRCGGRPERCGWRDLTCDWRS
mmetsp:Transcript_51885/g.152945  ORF Transcript_51885/g.152945 Transcript_51885/m.152945 type:complete len:460 (-) Transcript_51885:16-1395(-)